MDDTATTSVNGLHLVLSNIMYELCGDETCITRRFILDDDVHLLWITNQLFNLGK